MGKKACHTFLKLTVNSSSCLLLSNQHSNDEDKQHNPYILEAQNQQLLTELSRGNNHCNHAVFYINYYIL